MLSTWLVLPVLILCASSNQADPLDLPVVQWNLEIPTESDDGRSQKDAFLQAQLLLGEAVFSRSPKEKQTLMARAQELFRRALARGSSLEKEDRAEAEEFLKALDREVSSSVGSTRRLQVVVLGLDLEDEVEELDQERFYDLQREIYRTVKDKNKAREAVSRAKKQCTRKLKVRSRWTTRDDQIVKRAVQEARKYLDEWTDGAIVLEMSRSVLKYPDVVNMTTNRSRSSGRTVLDPSRPWQRGIGPEIITFLEKKMTGSVDMVLVVPKYMTRKGEMRAPGVFYEASRSIAPLWGRIPAAQVGLHSLKTSRKKSDGAEAEFPLGRRIGEATYGALREALMSISGAAARVKSLLPSPRTSPTRLEERAVFFEDAFSVRMPKEGLQLLHELSRLCEDGLALRVQTGWPELSDRHVQTARELSRGGTHELTLSRGAHTGGFGLILDRARTDKKAPLEPLLIELETDDAMYRFQYPSHFDNLVPLRLPLPETIDVRHIRIRRSARDARERLLVCEVFLFRT